MVDRKDAAKQYVYLKKTRPCDDVLALHVDKLLHGKALVVREVDEQRLRHDLEVLFDSDRKKTKLSQHETRDSCQFLAPRYDHGLGFGDELKREQQQQQHQ